MNVQKYRDKYQMAGCGLQAHSFGLGYHRATMVETEMYLDFQLSQLMMYLYHLQYHIEVLMRWYLKTSTYSGWA
jgi:hypothetical protein